MAEGGGVKVDAHATIGGLYGIVVVVIPVGVHFGTA
jgi:hypothetical protein